MTTKIYREVGGGSATRIKKTGVVTKLSQCDRFTVLTVKPDEGGTEKRVAKPGRMYFSVGDKAQYDELVLPLPLKVAIAVEDRGDRFLHSTYLRDEDKDDVPKCIEKMQRQGLVRLEKRRMSSGFTAFSRATLTCRGQRLIHDEIVARLVEALTIFPPKNTAHWPGQESLDAFPEALVRQSLYRGIDDGLLEGEVSEGLSGIDWTAPYLRATAKGREFIARYRGELREQMFQKFWDHYSRPIIVGVVTFVIGGVSMLLVTEWLQSVFDFRPPTEE